MKKNLSAYNGFDMEYGISFLGIGFYDNGLGMVARVMAFAELYFYGSDIINRSGIFGPFYNGATAAGGDIVDQQRGVADVSIMEDMDGCIAVMDLSKAV